MRIAVASGKGGTGKTTVAVNLACVLAESGRAVQYLDCDVEEPNGHIFLKPRMTATESVGIPVPLVDENKCTGCRKCAEVCRYHAIVVLRKPLVFPELCHGCGGCRLACPENAIREADRPIGVVETGQAGAVAFVQGRLNVGESMAPPLIRAVKKKIAGGGVAILDAPPGTSCPVVAVVRDADYVLLVTEPTPFGLHDLELAVEMIRDLGVRHGVVINRADSGYRRVHEYCAAERIPVLLEISDDRRVAEAYSRGSMAARVLPEWPAKMRHLWARMQEAFAADIGAPVRTLLAKRAKTDDMNAATVPSVDVLVIGTDPPCPRCDRLVRLVATIAAEERPRICVRHTAFDSPDSIEIGLRLRRRIGTAKEVAKAAAIRVDWDAVHGLIESKQRTLPCGSRPADAWTPELDEQLRICQDAAGSVGFLMTPVLVIDGVVRHHGSVPTLPAIRAWVRQAQSGG